MKPRSHPKPKHRINCDLIEGLRILLCTLRVQGYSCTYLPQRPENNTSMLPARY